MLKGKKTYLGILTIVVGLVLGWFGIGECDPSVVDAVCQNADQITTKITGAIDELLEIGGVLLAAYGRAKATT